MQRAKVFDAWSIDGKPFRFTVIVDGCHEIADLRQEDEKAFGHPTPGDEVFVLKQRKRGLFIVGRGEKLGPSAYL